MTMYKFYIVKIQVRYEYEVPDNDCHPRDPAFDSHTEEDIVDGSIYVVAEDEESARAWAEKYDITIPEECGKVVEWWITDVKCDGVCKYGEEPDLAPDSVALDLPNLTWL